MASHDDERITLELDVIDAGRRRIRAPSRTETERGAVRKQILFILACGVLANTALIGVLFGLVLSTGNESTQTARYAQQQINQLRSCQDWLKGSRRYDGLGCKPGCFAAPYGAQGLSLVVGGYVHSRQHFK